MKRARAGVLMVSLLAATPALAQRTVYYVHTDALGSVVMVTDANRNVVERTQYAPYGQVLNRPEHEGPGYTGHEEDPATGMTNMQARYDDKVIGRMDSIDPVGVDPDTGANFNRYAYANDNPYRYTDPDGRCADGFSCDQMVQSFSGQPSSPRAAELAASMLPGVGDAVNITEAYNNPSLSNLAIAVVGLVPEAGAAVADIAKIARVAEAAKEGAAVAKGAAGGERAGKVFTRAGKEEVKEANAATHDGQTTCSHCGQSTVPAQQSRAGVTPPENETHVDHIIPKSKGGNGSSNNGQVLCRACNLRKSDKEHRRL